MTTTEVTVGLESRW